MTIDQVGRDELSGHLILLGGAEGDWDAGSSGQIGWFIRRLELPVHIRLPQGGDEEFDMEFVINTDEEGKPTYGGTKDEIYRPRFLLAESEPDRPRVVVDGIPRLEYELHCSSESPTQSTSVPASSFARGSSVEVLMEEYVHGRGVACPQ